MSSKAELIASAATAALTTPPMVSVPAARIFRDLDDALATDQFPAVLLELGDEPTPEAVFIGVLDRKVDLFVTVLATGNSPVNTADAAVVEACDRLFADRTLGGAAIDIEEGETLRQRAAFGEHVAAVRKTYRVHYRTAEGSIE